MFRNKNQNRSNETKKPAAGAAARPPAISTARAAFLLAGGVFALALAGFHSAATGKVSGESLFETVRTIEEPFVEEGFSSANQNFTRFPHTIEGHGTLSCLMCHRRETNAARLQLPGHSPCAGCHMEEFQKPAGASRMCTICHTNPASTNPPVKSFPGLRSFNVKFSHLIHTRRGATPREGCATCHRPTQNGAARSIPTGFNAHATCFQCHTNRAQVGGRDISSCSTCHEIGRFTRVSAGSKAYRINFRHNGHASQSCATCHQVRAGARGNQVTSTAAAMHFPPARAQSCATCHDNKKAFGGSDFRDCKRCHTGGSFRF